MRRNLFIMIYVHIYLLGPIVVMILEKENAVLDNRELMGATNPKDASDGTIRKNMEYL